MSQIILSVDCGRATCINVWGGGRGEGGGGCLPGSPISYQLHTLIKVHYPPSTFILPV